MTNENPTWGAPRVHDELLMLGFDVSERTVSRMMPRRPADPEARQRWRNFLRNHREVLAAIEPMSIRRKQISPYSPWQNGAAERWVATVRRDLLDQVIVLNERHLHRLLSEFVAYYHDDRTHLGLGKGTPSMRRATSTPSSDAEDVSDDVRGPSEGIRVSEPRTTRLFGTRALPRREVSQSLQPCRTVGLTQATLDSRR